MSKVNIVIKKSMININKAIVCPKIKMIGVFNIRVLKKSTLKELANLNSRKPNKSVNTVIEVGNTNLYQWILLPNRMNKVFLEDGFSVL